MLSQIRRSPCVHCPAYGHDGAWGVSGEQKSSAAGLGTTAGLHQEKSNFLCHPCRTFLALESRRDHIYMFNNSRAILG
jgi:hypothetical protein